MYTLYRIDGFREEKVWDTSQPAFLENTRLNRFSWRAIEAMHAFNRFTATVEFTWERERYTIRRTDQ